MNPPTPRLVAGACPRLRHATPSSICFLAFVELVRRSRYLHKNSGFVRELVANMAIYSTGDGIKPQALSPNPGWNKAAEEYFNHWAARCEVTNRFSFAECQALVCRGMDVDGEYFVHKTRNLDGTLSIVPRQAW